MLRPSGDDTFGKFPEHLRAIVSHALPKLSVAAITYPKYETRGDLHDCVARFKEWLQNKVIDLEVNNGTPSPTVDPSVHTILVGHSMGGIVAAETVLSILSEKPISSSRPSTPKKEDSSDRSSFMFPYVQGILAFDTPYLGIAPGVVAHGAEKNWNAVTQAYSTYTNVAGAFGMGSPRSQSPAGRNTPDASKALPPPEVAAAASAKAASGAANNAEIASSPGWGKWGKYAMFAGAAGAVVAGGAAAYMKKDTISEGWSWVGSHLEFVGCLARGQELQQRVQKIVDLEKSTGLGFADIYTALGRAVEENSNTWSKSITGEQRTFCTIPNSEVKKYFYKATNDAATAETWAHMSMFVPKSNPGYYAMGELAKELVVKWMDNQWYAEAEVESKGKGKGKETSAEDNDVEMVGQPAEADMKN